MLISSILFENTKNKVFKIIELLSYAYSYLIQLLNKTGLEIQPFIIQICPSLYRKMEYFRVAKFLRFCLKNMSINIRGF